MREGTDGNARLVAEKALAEADVSSASLSTATSFLDLSKTDHERRSTSAVEFEGEAYMLAVTLQVKDALDAAGYPDTDRVMEVWSQRACS